MPQSLAPGDLESSGKQIQGFPVNRFGQGFVSGPIFGRDYATAFGHVHGYAYFLTGAKRLYAP